MCDLLVSMKRDIHLLFDDFLFKTEGEMKKIDPRTLRNLELQNENSGEAGESEPILALDYGARFCGLAFCLDGILVLPGGIFETDNVIFEIQKVAQARGIKKIVVGLPISGDGTENEMCAEIRSFVDTLQRNVSTSIEFINEQFSSQNTIPSRKEKDKKDRIDDLAAMQILEFYLQKVRK